MSLPTATASPWLADVSASLLIPRLFTRTRSRPCLLSMILIVCGCVAPTRAGEMFPFVLPWDDNATSATNLSSWLESPAGRNGFVTARDGHLFAGTERIRFFGVNMCFGANFPSHEDAEKIAARLAKFGINCVRFHHMDMYPAPNGILSSDGLALDPDRLDRLDYFIAQLKKHGIYANLNLHVSRTYPDRPKQEKEGNENFDKGVDNFSAPLIELQKTYARDLLTHENPYTRTRYVDEPAVAFIEINNENALLFSWHTGALDRAASPYREELSELWTRWLLRKYGTVEAAGKAWKGQSKPAGPDLIRLTGFQHDAWRLEQHEGASARAENVDNTVMRVEVQKTAPQNWHVQIGYAGLKLKEGEPLELSFRARGSRAFTLGTALSQAHEPWQGFAQESFDVTPEWKHYSAILQPDGWDDNARLTFQFGRHDGWIELSDVSLRTAAVDSRIAIAPNGHVPAFTKREYTTQTGPAQKDWQAFLWFLEEQYWTGMHTFLREQLKAKSLILGTQLFWSPFPIQQQLDVIDSHAYWQHPHFPGKAWDRNEWIVKNEAMTGHEKGGTLSRLALQRVAGKPYICTEYNHSAPNSYGAETFPLICAMAALQDWDGIFAFAYSHRKDDWQKGYFEGFFDIDRHSVKMATLPASIALFLRGDVSPARERNIVEVTLEDAMKRMRQSGPHLSGEHFGIDPLSAFVHQSGITLGPITRIPNRQLPAGGVVTSDTGELRWDTERKVASIQTERSAAVMGSIAHGKYRLGEATVSIGELRNGFGVVQLTSLSSAPLETSSSILITATADSENSGMKWTSPKRDSVGGNWGAAPTLVEGVPATITLPGKGKFRAWSLDEKGQRASEIPVKDRALNIGPDYQTLWYEVERTD